jgi:hypothetical protein
MEGCPGWPHTARIPPVEYSLCYLLGFRVYFWNYIWQDSLERRFLHRRWYQMKMRTWMPKEGFERLIPVFKWLKTTSLRLRYQCDRFFVEYTERSTISLNASRNILSVQMILRCEGTQNKRTVTSEVHFTSSAWNLKHNVISSAGHVSRFL